MVLPAISNLFGATFSATRGIAGHLGIGDRSVGAPLTFKDDLPGILEIVAGEGARELLDPHRIDVGEKPLHNLCGP